MLLAGGLALPAYAQSDPVVGPVETEAEFPIPAPVLSQLNALITQTLHAVLGAEGSISGEALAADPEGVADQIRTGLNLALIDRGYTVTALTLTPGDPLEAHATVALAAAGVETVTVALAPTGFHPFWDDRAQAILADLGPALIALYEPALIGLPLGALDPTWARDLALAEVSLPASVTEAFEGYDVDLDVTVAADSLVSLSLTPRGERRFEVLRVEARSDSLLMVTLDPLEERLLAASDLVVGQPIELVQQEEAALEAEFARLARETEPARTFQVETVEANLWFPEDRPEEARCTVVVESAVYHLRARAFIDLGNDDRPAELQALGGYRLAGPLEAFAQLNLLTKDLELETDLGLGFYEHAWFLGAAWDCEEGTLKGIAAWSPSPLFRVSAEIYDSTEERQNQLGLLYQPTQQLGLGVFTDADSSYWVRTEFRL